jgi:hypothetical protein
MGMFKFYMRSKRAFPLDYALNMPGLVTRSGEVARALSLGKVYRNGGFVAAARIGSGPWSSPGISKLHFSRTQANQPEYDINELQQRRQVRGDFPPATLPNGG